MAAPKTAAQPWDFYPQLKPPSARQPRTKREAREQSARKAQEMLARMKATFGQPG